MWRNLFFVMQDYYLNYSDRWNSEFTVTAQYAIFCFCSRPYLVDPIYFPSSSLF
jgi:hypothetical protein